MKTTAITKLFLVLSILLWGSNMAWADTIESLGSNDTGWASSNHAYTVAANKTLTLTFTVTSTKGESETQGYYVEVNQSGSNKMGFQPGGGFYYFGDAWWNEDHIVKNDRSWANLSDFTSFIPGSTVELTIKRIHTQLLYYADITTSASARHYRRLITKESTFDENEDVEVKLGADFAVLSGITDVITDESITGTLIGKEDNSADYNGEGASSEVFTLGTGKTLTLNFINYSSKIGWGDNWYLRIQNGSKYFDLRSDYWGGESDGAGYYFRTEENTSPGYFTLSSSTGAYFDNFPKALHKANVNLTVERSGNIITITVAQTCTNSVIKTQKYTLTHNDFASGDITVTLYAAWSHLDLLPVTTTISSFGWATFSSDYALDFSKATEGLTAYMITGRDGTTVTKNEVTGTVPAGTGLLLKGDAGSYNIPIVGSSTTDVSANLMKPGTGDAISAETGYTRYVLGVNNNTAEDTSDDYAEFQKIVSTAATVAKGKAYLEFEGTVPAPSLKFDFDFSTPTAINAVETATKVQQSNDVYNLAGQRVAQPKKGLYIVNGKKIIK